MGGKTRSGLSLTRPGPPTPFFIGEGSEKRKRGMCSCALVPKSPLKKQVATQHLEGRATELRSRQGGERPRGSSSNVRTVGAGCALRSPDQRAGRAGRAHACSGRAFPAPSLSAFAFPFPQRSAAATSEPPPLPTLSFGGGGAFYPSTD